MVVSGPVTRSTLRQQIADALRDEVLAGRLHPGQEFTVKQIAEQYGVSTTPVREALVDLSAQGLLDSDQHKGFRVHQFTVRDYRGMVEARALIVDGLYRRLTERGVPVAGAGALGGGQVGGGTCGPDPSGGDDGTGGPGVAGVGLGGAGAAGVGPGAVGAAGGGPGAAGVGLGGAGVAGGASVGPGGLGGGPGAAGGGRGAGASGGSCLREGALTPVRRRAEAAARAARAGDLDILIGYDLRFWRELCGLVANRYVADFLHHLRVQAWVFAVPYLRGDRRLCDWLWSGHVELVDAVSEGVPDEVMAVIDAYNAHALRWADHLEGTGR